MFNDDTNCIGCFYSGFISFIMIIIFMIFVLAQVYGAGAPTCHMWCIFQTRAFIIFRCFFKEDSFPNLGNNTLSIKQLPLLSKVRVQVPRI